MNNDDIKSIGVPTAVTTRTGTTENHGHDYESGMAALLSLKALANKSIKHIWLASNLDECGAFDDLIFHVVTDEEKKITYLIQLKHKKDSINGIKSSEFKKKKSDFLIEKYYNSIVQIKNAMDDAKDQNEVIAFLRSNRGNLVFIIYTNQPSGKHDFLNKITKSAKIVNKWMLYSFVDTGGCISKIDCGKLGLTCSSVYQELLERLFMFSGQIQVRGIDSKIVNELMCLFGNVPFSKQTYEDLTNQYLQFFVNWHKGRLGGSFPLTESDIHKVLLGAVLKPYIFTEVTQSCGTKLRNYEMWKSLIGDKSVVIVEDDEVVADFVSEYISVELNTFQWAMEPNSINRDIFRSMDAAGGLDKGDTYKYLWKTKRLPLVIKVENSDELNNLLKILLLLPNTFTVLILANQTPNIEDVCKNLQNFTCEQIREILNVDVKLQGRASVKLNRYFTNDRLYHYVSIKDIIYILSNQFSIGEDFSHLPELYVERTLQKIWFKPSILEENKEDMFVIKCNNEHDLKDFILKHKLEIKVSSFLHWLGDDVEIANVRIITFSNYVNVEEIINSDMVKNKTVHYLMLLESKYLQWVRTYGTTKGISKYRTPKSNDLASPMLVNSLNKITLISDYPGMGKTWLLDYMSCKIPTEMWVIKINLLQHIDFYKGEDFLKKDIADYLQYFFNEDNQLEKFIFETHSQTKDVIFLLDGFDEVPFSRQDKVLKLIETIVNSDFSLVLTTRPNFKLLLEDKLDTFGISINNFMVDDQRIFLERFFRNACNMGPSERINIFIEKLLSSAKQNLNDYDEEFAGLPLQSQLLGEVFLNDCKRFMETGRFECEHFDLINLYKSFIDKKIQIACKKLGSNWEDTFHNYKTFRSLYALKFLFSSSDLKDLKIEDRIDMVGKLLPGLSNEIQKDGIIILEREGNVNFVHRSFAEYLSAEWLANSLNSEERENVRILIKKLYHPSFVTVRNMFDRILAEDRPLHLAIISRQFKHAKALLGFSLTETDKEGRNVTHLIASWGAYQPTDSKFIKDLDAVGNAKKAAETDPMLQILRKIPYGDFVALKDRLLNGTPIDYALITGSLSLADAMCERLKNTDLCINWNYSNYAYSYGYPYIASILDKHLFNSEITEIVKTIPKNELHNKTIPSEDINKVDTFGFTPLHISIILGINPLTQSFLAKGARVNIKDGNGRTALHWAVIKGATGTLSTMLQSKRYPDVDTVDTTGKTPLHYAVLANIPNRKEIVSILLKNNANPTLKDSLRNTFLNYAVHFNQMDIFDLLLTMKNLTFMQGLITRKDFLRSTVFHRAVEKGLSDIATVLISLKRENTRIVDKYQKTIVHCAAEKGYTDMLNKLLSLGEYFDAKDKKGRTPLMYAAIEGHVDMVKLLLTKNPNIEVKDSEGLNAYQWTTRKGHLDILKLFLESGANINAKTAVRGNSLWAVAAFYNCGEVLSFLLQHEVDVDERNVDGETALHLARKLEIVEILLLHNADVNAPDRKGMTPLIHAAINGNAEVVNSLLTRGPDIEVVDVKGCTAYQWTVREGFFDILKLFLQKGVDVIAESALLIDAAFYNRGKILSLLLEKGARVDGRDVNGETALHVASSQGYLQIVEDLLLHNADVDVLNNKGRTPLICAAMEDRTEVVKLLLTKNPDVDVVDEQGLTACEWAAHRTHLNVVKLFLSAFKTLKVQVSLLTAAYYNQIELVIFLLANGANVDERDSNNKTALHLACSKGYLQIVAALLSHNANVNALDEVGRTPLMSAAIEGQVELVKVQLTKDVDIEKVDEKGYAAHQLAVQRGHLHVLKLLLEKGANIDAKVPPYENSLLAIATVNSYGELVRFLLDQKVDIEQRNCLGETALHLACYKGYQEIVAILLSYNANVNALDGKGRTPLMCAVTQGRTKVVELLLANKVDVEFVDTEGLTALKIAKRKRRQDIIKIFLERKVRR